MKQWGGGEQIFLLTPENLFILFRIIMLLTHLQFLTLLSISPDHKICFSTRSELIAQHAKRGQNPWH